MKQNAEIAIAETFKLLVNKKYIDKITVKEICVHCQINRQTFYNHFSDIVDVFKFVFYQELSREIAQNRTIETWDGGFLATLNYLKKHSVMIYHIYNSTYWTEANIYFSNLSARLLEGVVEECCNKKGIILNLKDERFIINFYRHVFNGLMLDWVSEGMEEKPEVLLQKLLIMITGSISRSVMAFVNK